VSAVHETLQSAPAAVAELIGRPFGEYRRACPYCAKRTKDEALAIRIDERGATWHCHRCHASGALNDRGATHRAPRSLVRPIQEVPQRWSEKAECIWRRARPLRGSLGEAYLTRRRCVIPPADGDLRYLAGTERYPPSLLARVTEIRTGAPLTLHFTRLKIDGTGKAGTDRDKLLLRGHQKKHGVIRLWPDQAIGSVLAVAEGIESALCAAHLHQPAWAAIDAGNLEDLEVIPGVESLIVYADHDPSGLKAARQAVRRWRAAGKAACAYMASTPGEDIADVIAKQGAT
jgi:putative DNA primase/helicase